MYENWGFWYLATELGLGAYIQSLQFDSQLSVKTSTKVELLQQFPLRFGEVLTTLVSNIILY